MQDDQTPKETTAQSAQESATAKEKPAKSTKLLWIGFAIFVIATIAAVCLFYLAKQDLQEARSAQATDLKLLQESSKKLSDTEEKLKAAEQKIKPLLANTAEFSKVSPQCSEKDNSNTLFVPVVEKEIAGHRIYLVHCLSATGNEAAPTHRLVVMKVNSDKNLSLAYGASNVNPLCITKSLPQNVSNELVQATGLDLCKS